MGVDIQIKTQDIMSYGIFYAYLIIRWKKCEIQARFYWTITENMLHDGTLINETKTTLLEWGLGRYVISNVLSCEVVNAFKGLSLWRESTQFRPTHTCCIPYLGSNGVPVDINVFVS